MSGGTLTFRMAAGTVDKSAGWISRLKAEQPQLRVTAGSAPFGRITYVVKAPRGHVLLTQYPRAAKLHEIVEPTAEQHAISEALQRNGIVLS